MKYNADRIVEFVVDHKSCFGEPFSKDEILRVETLFPSMRLIVHGINFKHSSVYYGFSGWYNNRWGRHISRSNVCQVSSFDDIHIFVLNKPRMLYVTMSNYKIFQLIWEENDQFHIAKITKLTIANIRKKCIIPSSRELNDNLLLLFDTIKSIIALNKLI